MQPRHNGMPFRSSPSSPSSLPCILVEAVTDTSTSCLAFPPSCGRCDSTLADLRLRSLSPPSTWSIPPPTASIAQARHHHQPDSTSIRLCSGFFLPRRDLCCVDPTSPIIRCDSHRSIPPAPFLLFVDHRGKRCDAALLRLRGLPRTSKIISGKLWYSDGSLSTFFLAIALTPLYSLPSFMSHSSLHRVCVCRRHLALLNNEI